VPSEPVIIPPPGERDDPSAGAEGKGEHLVVGEWGGTHVGEVAPLHVHHSDDEAWHVIEGTVRFRFADGHHDAQAGSTVFVPAGVPHTFGNPGPGAVRYLIITSARLNRLISELHQVDRAEHPEVFRRYDSELLE
jgi:mannose-6-phosphate isomerase-like protein (cupin superfamily)